MKNISILLALLILSTLAYSQSDIRNQLNLKLRKERIEKEIETRKIESIERHRTNQLKTRKTQGTRRTEDPYMKPLKGKYYYWVSNNWEYGYTTEYTYDIEKRVIMRVTKDSTSGDLFGKTETIYTNNGNVASITYYYHDGTSWIPSDKDSTSYHASIPDFQIENFGYNYDELSQSWEIAYANKTEVTLSNNNVTEIKNLDWDGTSWDEFSKTVYAYDGNNKLISETTYYYSNPENKTNYLYTSNVLSEIVYQYWDVDSSNWINTERYYGLKFGNFTGELVDYVIFYQKDFFLDAKLEEFYNDMWIGEWINAGKGIIVHNANGYIFTSSEYTGFTYEDYSRETYTKGVNQIVSLYEMNDNGTWVNNFRQTTFLDSDQQERGVKYELWDGVSNEWKVDWWQETISEFDANGKIIQKTQKMWDFMTSTLVNSEKEVYSDWKDFNPAGINTTQLLKNVAYYPNPTTDKLTIQFQNPTGLENQITMLDITGKIVYLTSGFEDRIIIPMGDIDAGIYIVKIVSGQEHTVARIVKQ